MKKLLMIMAMVAVIAMAGMADAAPIVQNNGAPYTDYGNSYSGSANYVEPAGGDTTYHYDYPSQVPVGRFWTPGLTGTYVVEASWATGHNHDVNYYFRSDGTAGSEAAIIGAQDVDQDFMADQVTLGPIGGAGWSGYFELGTFTLIPSSTFRMHDPTAVDTTHHAITTGLWQFSEPGGAVPEPAGLGLIGLALLAVRRKRS